MGFRDKYLGIASKLKQVIQDLNLVDASHVRIGGKVRVASPPCKYIFIIPTECTGEPTTVERPPIKQYEAEYEIVVILAIKEIDDDSLEQAQTDVLDTASKIVDALLENYTLDDTVDEVRVPSIANMLTATEDFRTFQVTIRTVVYFTVD